MILDKLLLTFGLTLLNGAVLNEPMRLNDTETNFTLYNGTENDLTYRDKSTGTSYQLNANSTMEVQYTYESSNDWAIIYDGDYDDIADLWYECLDSIALPATPEWERQPYGSLFQVEGMTSVSHGLGVYEYRFYSNQDLYIDPAKWGGIAKGVNNYSGNITITPENANAIKIFKEDGNYNTATKIMARRLSYEESFNYATVIYAVINGQNIMMANNFGVNINVINGMPLPPDPKAIQPYLTYYNGWTNRVSLGNAELMKNAEVDPYTGYEPLGYPNLSTSPIGYIAMGERTQEETAFALTSGFTLAYMAFTAIAPLFSFIVFPGISIGLLICIPLIMTLLFMVIKIIKKGG